MLVVGAVALSALAGCADDGVVFDNWGPPAGYAVLAGTARQAGGAPVAGLPVAFTRCGAPVGGFLAADTTDAAGRFRVAAQLPPRGLLPPGVADTLQLRCKVILAWNGVVHDSVYVRFASTVEAAPITTVDLTLP
jgi:hypothetical protein